MQNGKLANWRSTKFGLAFAPVNQSSHWHVAKFDLGHIVNLEELIWPHGRPEINNVYIQC